MQRTICCLAFGIELLSTVFGQPQQTAAVTGLPGQIEVTRNATNTAYIVLLSPMVPGSVTASGRPAVAVTPMAYVLQSEPSRVPQPLVQWSGSGRVLRGDGVLAVIGDDGVKYLFKFPDRATPASLNKLFGSQEALEIFGLAVHGETEPLTVDQIAALKVFAHCNRDASGVKPAGVTPLNVPACTNCSSGGEGATSCSSGAPYNCSVSCTGAYSACCNGATGQCTCCKS